MKVRELRALLETASDDDEVVLAKDAEGNGYSPLSGGWLATYVPESRAPWSGEVYLRELDDEALESGYTEEDVYDGDDGIPALVLSPTN